MASDNVLEAPYLTSASATQLPDPTPIPPPTKCWSTPSRRRSRSLNRPVLPNIELYPACLLSRRTRIQGGQESQAMPCLHSCRQRAYSDTMNFICVWMSLAIVWSNTLFLQGDSNHPLPCHASSNGVVVASHDSLNNQ
ncbi:LOW QUALITY PROTEIN: hypothetical protein ACHAW6_003810 [Cyclotella cf. meneghiniana]